ncbi:MAG: mechanosensitive ion channel family protein [Candidatus Gracilibacteria bacterium]|nr:mechanosensitive ion channel family protein [Candidatus Gracilibacteria bacterium]
MKNTFYILIGTLYFGLTYFFKNNGTIQNLFGNYYPYFEKISSYIDSVMLFLIILGLIGFLIKLLNRLTNKFFQTGKFLKLLGDSFVRFLEISKYIIAVYSGIQLAYIPDNAIIIIDKIFRISFIFVFILLITSFLKSVFKILAKGKENSDLSKQVFPILSTIIIVFIWIVGGLTILGNLGFDISALITGAGVGGLAIALAAQKSVANIFGAISIILNKPFKVGEMVRIDTFTGNVKEIGLTYLELTDLTGNKILIPNESLISSVIENLTQRENRKNEFFIGVVYETKIEDMKKGIKAIESILEKHVKKKELDSYRVYFDTFGASSLDIKVTYFSLLNEDYNAYVKQKEVINFEIKKQFEELGLDIAFNTQEIRLKQV